MERRTQISGSPASRDIPPTRQQPQIDARTILLETKRAAHPEIAKQREDLTETFERLLQSSGRMGSRDISVLAEEVGPNAPSAAEKVGSFFTTTESQLLALARAYYKLDHPEASS